jgi:hypothetical protein
VTRLRIPALGNVPVYSQIERYCRYAGEEPKSNEDGRRNRKRWLRRIARLLRQDDVSRADLRCVGDYLKGKFDREPGQGRPENYEQERVRQLLAGRVEAIRREQGCSRDVALRTFLTENAVEMRMIENGVERWVTSDDDPDDELFSYIRSYINR